MQSKYKSNYPDWIRRLVFWMTHGVWAGIVVVGSATSGGSDRERILIGAINLFFIVVSVVVHQRVQRRLSQSLDRFHLTQDQESLKEAIRALQDSYGYTGITMMTSMMILRWPLSK